MTENRQTQNVIKQMLFFLSSKTVDVYIQKVYKQYTNVDHKLAILITNNNNYNYIYRLYINNDLYYNAYIITEICIMPIRCIL